MLLHRALFLVHSTLLIGVVVVVITAIDLAQSTIREGGNFRVSGNNVIRGRVYLPDGRPITKAMRVSLSGPNAGDDFTTTDQSGNFVFYNLGEGSYHITVEAGDEFELATQTVDVFGSPSPLRASGSETLAIQIDLRPRLRVQKAGTIDASDKDAPKPALKLYDQGVQLANKGKIDEAMLKFHGALAIKPDFVPALNALALGYIRKRQLDDADKTLKLALRTRPDEFHSLLNYGILLVIRGDNQKGAEMLRRAVAQDPDSSVAHLSLGRALIPLKDYSGAESELKRTIELGGKEGTMAHRYLCAVYVDEHRNDLAERELAEYLKLDPKAEDAPKLRGMLDRLRTGQTNAAAAS